MEVVESALDELLERFGAGPVNVWKVVGKSFDEEFQFPIAEVDQLVFNRAVVLPQKDGLRTFIFRRSGEPYSILMGDYVIYKGARYPVKRVENFSFACVVYAQV